MLNRRTFVTALSTAILARPAILRAAEPLTLWGPPAAPSIVLTQAIASGALKDIAPGATFKSWRTPDEMRAGLSSGNMTAVIVPTYVAANLYNRGLGVRLANVMTKGLLYVVAPTGTVTDIASLKGKRVAVPFRNDMPDFIFRRLLVTAKLQPSDITIDYSGTPPEAIQMLVAGRVDAALLAEPASSAAILRAMLAAGQTLERAIDCQKAWAAATGYTAIPQAGLAITDKLASQIGADGASALQAALENAVQSVNRNPAAAAAIAAPALELPAPVIERSIAFSNLVAERATRARNDLTALFETLAKDDLRIIGGKLPDDRFYAL
ncbi:MAG: ABC transporter substrate-binding protein [Afipia sp.]|nr:ABC transporter substrate-binding protein [Afipia sp.]OJW59786.1 MAG: nitrate ABC transporter substrate-binding protein [Afipia sp. 64-13]